MKVTCVLGVPCVGKTTYCRKLVEEAGGNRPVFVSVGSWMRGAMGTEFFVAEGCHGASPTVEQWVRSMIHHAFATGGRTKKNVLLDGAPRSVDQLRWMCGCFQNWLSVRPESGKSPDAVELLFLYAPEGVIAERMRERTKLAGVDFALAEGELISAAGRMAAIRETAELLMAEGKMSWLSIREGPCRD